MATKERSKIEKPNPRRPSAKTSPVKHAQTNAELRQQLAESLQRENATASENERLLNALTEALEHQTATARGAWHHQPLAHGCAAGIGCDRRERRTGLWN
jgi:hypothetical protein